MTFFVTGISGFVGPYLAARLLEAGHRVFGTGMGIRIRPLPELHERYPDRFPSGNVVERDIRDGASLRAMIRDARPAGVFHLAGLTFVPRSFEEPQEAYGVNFLGAVELLAAVRDEAPKARVVFVSTGEVYGRVDPADVPVREDRQLRPLSPYSVGKAAADMAAFQFFWAHGLDVVRARPFNHTGPGQSPTFVCSEFARGVAAIEAGQASPSLRVGNLDVERDFSDVRDIVRGYVALFEKGKAGEAYNLGSGRAVSVRRVLEQLLEKSSARTIVETDPAKVRPSEMPRLFGSIEKVTADTGWKPEISLDRTLADLLEYWRSELRLR